MINIQDLYLVHHGVQGQKWGVHNGPPYPLDSSVSDGNKLKASKPATGLLVGLKYKVADRQAYEKHKIKKGTKMYRMTTNENEVEKGSTYVTYQPADRQFYGAWVAGNAVRDNKKATEVTMKLKEDLIVPGRDDMSEAFDNALKKNGIKTVNKALVDFVIGDRVRNGDIASAKKKYDALVKANNDLNEFIKKAKPDDEIKWKRTGTVMEYSDPKTGKTIAKRDDAHVLDAQAYASAKASYDRILNNWKNKKMSDIEVGMATLTKNPKIKSSMISYLQSKGFNAMVDEAGAGIMPIDSTLANREGFEPLIIFDREKSLGVKKKKNVYNPDLDTYSKAAQRIKIDDDYRKSRRVINYFGPRKRLTPQ